MHRLILVTLVAGCSFVPSSPTATVTVRSGWGEPLDLWPVAFHGSDGRLLDSTLTDETGTAEGPMEPDGMVTYFAARIGTIVTRAGIQPGDHVVNMVLPEPAAETTTTLVVDTANVPAAARLCRLVVPCGDRAIEARGVPGVDIVIELPETCASVDGSGKRIVSLVATATDERAEAIAYAGYEALALPTPSTRITLDRWRSDFVEVPVDITGIDPDLYRYTLDVIAHIGEAPVAWARFGDDPPTPVDRVSAMARFPVDTGTTILELDALYDTGEIRIEAAQPTGTPLSLDASDYPPRMTEIALEPSRTGDDRPTIRFHTKHALDPDAIIDAVLTEAGGGVWILKNLRGTENRLPELPTAFWIAVPSDLKLESVGATVRTEREIGVLVSTTANPHVPSLHEFPFASPGY